MKNKRVRLVKTFAPEAFPVGSLGTILDGTMDEPGMLRVRWDRGYNIPMYRSELELVEDRNALHQD